MRTEFFVGSFVVLAGVAIGSAFASWVLWSLVVVLPIVGVGIYDVIQPRRSLLRNYPVIGHGRYLLEEIRPEIQQYFVESNVDGAPFSREQRSVVYQRAKQDIHAVPFGTQHDVYRPGHEWINHSLVPRRINANHARVVIGGPDCTQPYRSSHLNISAMSYGALSKNAILALNQGAKDGGFAHNTGEGGISPYHLEHGGDLIWQIGTGYFGCRTKDGRFDPSKFAEAARHRSVKMIEIKLSQGAKPAHGGILPAAKLTAEIAEIRQVPMGVDVLSPAAHSTFGSPLELIEWIAELRTLSDGKPIGFKLCVGDKSEFLCICKAMLETGITPDFITVDGAEGGTGAAPLEFTNSVGAPLREGLLFVHNALVGIGARDRIRIIASGKLVSGFDILRTMALGADLCASARAMLFALGCIQARRCNTNTCPVGIATTNESLTKGLNVPNKAERVASFHKETTHAFLSLAGAAGLPTPGEVRPHHIWHRVSQNEVRSYEELYEFLNHGQLVIGQIPAEWKRDWDRASAESFVPQSLLRSSQLMVVLN